MAAVRGEAAEVDEPRVSVGGVYERVCAIVEIEIAKIRKEAEAERARKDEADRKKEDALKLAGDDKALADFRKKKKKEEPDPVISQTPQARGLRGHQPHWVGISPNSSTAGFQEHPRFVLRTISYCTLKAL